MALAGLVVAVGVLLVLTRRVESPPALSGSDRGDSNAVSVEYGEAREDCDGFANIDVTDNAVEGTQRYADTGAVELTPIFEDYVTVDPETMGVEIYAGGGMNFKKDGWVYFAEYDFSAPLGYSESLFRKRADGSEKMQITPDRSAGFTIAGEWVYYMNGDYTHWTVRKVRLDGTGDTVIYDDALFIIEVSGDWMLCSYNNANDRSLYRMRTDGTDKTKIMSDPIYSHVSNGDWFFYTTGDGGYSEVSIYKVRTDGTGKAKIYTGCYSITLKEITREWIYFSAFKFDGDPTWVVLYKIRHDGTGFEEVDIEREIIER